MFVSEIRVRVCSPLSVPLDYVGLCRAVSLTLVLLVFLFQCAVYSVLSVGTNFELLLLVKHFSAEVA